jgi:hypothetical protein
LRLGLKFSIVSIEWPTDAYRYNAAAAKLGCPEFEEAALLLVELGEFPEFAKRIKRFPFIQF